MSAEPTVMVDSYDILCLITVVVLRLVGEAVLDGIRAVFGGETVVGVVGISGVVVQPHRSAVVVLVESAGVIAYRQAVVNKYFMVRKLSAHLKAVSVSLAGVLFQRNGYRISVAIDDLRTHFAVEPSLIDTQRTRMLAHVVIRRTVLVTDTMLDDGVGVADALEEIPAVIAVIPCAATDIVVSRSGELFVGKTVGIAAEISRRAGHGLVVKIIVRIDILDDVIAAVLHLTAGVGRAVYVEVLKQAVRTFVVEVVLSGIAQREVLDMQVGAGVLDLQSACAVRGGTEIEYRRVGAAASDTFVTGYDDALGRRTVQFLDSCVAQVILAAEQIERVAGIRQFLQSVCEGRGFAERTIAFAVRRSIVGGSTQADGQQRCCDKKK